MKTYTKTTITEEPLLEITHDESPQSPREDTNLGYFITVGSSYRSPDKHEEFKNIIVETGEEATSQAEHIDDIEKKISEETAEEVIAIYPIVKYEHSEVSYSLGSKQGFDYSNNGFYIITKESQKETGVLKKDFKKVINQELEIYSKYCNGEVYDFILYDNDGEILDSCSGFYNIEDIREHLPKEWKKENLEEYFIS